MKKTAAKINDQGFTLLEMLVGMTISGIIMAGIYSTYYSQQKSSVVQGQVAAMQQNLRAAMSFMTAEIRMAGYDPRGSAGAGLVTADSDSDSIRVTMDTTEDGAADDADEDVTYSLYDADGDGDNDLGRNTGSGNDPVAANIDALSFVYLDAGGAGHGTPSNETRSVQITIVARTDREDPGFTNNETYTNQWGDPIYTAPGDHYRRRRLTAQVKCRNLGL